MAIFTWTDPVACGDDPPPDSCAPLDGKTTVKALRATDVDGCEVDLTSTEYPAIASLIGDEQTIARSGSSAQPIPLSRVQSYAGESVPEIFFRNAAGQLAAWNPPIDCDNKRVVVDSGSFTCIDDINSNVFSEACIGSISDATHIAGATEFVDCNGITRVKLVFFPKEQFCTFCES